jgi:hypothetical protein
MLNKGSDMLEEILEVSKKSGDMKGIWFDYNPMNNIFKNSLKKFVPSDKKPKYQMLDHMSQ